MKPFKKYNRRKNLAGTRPWNNVVSTLSIDIDTTSFDVMYMLGTNTRRLNNTCLYLGPYCFRNINKFYDRISMPYRPLFPRLKGNALGGHTFVYMAIHYSHSCQFECVRPWSCNEFTLMFNQILAQIINTSHCLYINVAYCLYCTKQWPTIVWECVWFEHHDLFHL